MNVLTDPAARLVIGHRGNPAHAPENTLESFAQAASLGVDALELDVRLTSDGIPVVVHDRTIARTTDRGGEVAAQSLAQIRKADAGAWFSRDAGATFPFRGRGLTIPTFDEVLAAFPRMPLLIEVKVAEAGQPVAEALARAGANDRCVFASMQGAAVAPLRPAWRTGASASEVARLLGLVLGGGRVRTVPYDALCIPPWYYGLPLPVTALARAARPAGVVTHLWTIDDPLVAKGYWEDGIQGIVTNDPAILIRARNELKR
ncbi:MAG TPA: glycerophosphodiester phosphodiesterase family protein [Gemmatimonadaceae bacterium]|jgi:glycerophosphoryl diester phosphodiesterase